MPFIFSIYIIGYKCIPKNIVTQQSRRDEITLIYNKALKP